MSLKCRYSRVCDYLLLLRSLQILASNVWTSHGQEVSAQISDCCSSLSLTENSAFSLISPKTIHTVICGQQLIMKVWAGKDYKRLKHNLKLNVDQPILNIPQQPPRIFHRSSPPLLQSSTAGGFSVPSIPAILSCLPLPPFLALLLYYAEPLLDSKPTSSDPQIHGHTVECIGLKEEQPSLCLVNSY